MTDAAVPAPDADAATAAAASLVQDAPPEIGDDDAARIAAEHFGFVGTARSLGSHQDRNFLIEGAHGRALLKVANPATTAGELEAQSLAAAHLAAHPAVIALGVRIPVARPGTDGALVQPVTVDGRRVHARLLDFLDGSPLSGGRYLSPALTRRMGELAGTVALAFAEVDVPGIERANQWDLRRAPAVLAAQLPSVADETLRARLRAAADAAWAAVSAVADALPVQVVHGDLTDDNVVSADAIGRLPDGIIDFGDVNRSWAVGELAITVSSLLHHSGATLPSALRAVVAYDAVRPLSDAEVDALWPLVVLRGTILVASAHHVLAADPANDYASENLSHEERIVEQALSLPPEVARELVRQAVGRTPRRAEAAAGLPLLPDLDTTAATVLDLSATSAALHGGRWLQPDAEAALAAEVVAGGASAALTRFAEPRLTRARPPRDAHPLNTPLGIEVQPASDQRVCAPWDGVLTATADGFELRNASSVLKVEGVAATVPTGTRVHAGQDLGRAGHGRRLLVTVAEGSATVPAFVAPELAAAWRVVAADPTPLVLGASVAARLRVEERERAAARDAEHLIERRTAAFAGAQEYYFDEPPVMVRGWREYLVDADARVYVDVLNNVTSIGHAHPRLVAAVTEQWSLLNTNSRFSYPSAVELSERLGALLPDGLSAVFLVNSGSEAVDLALRIARAASGRRDVLAVREAYHGWTDLSDAVSTSIADNPGALETRPDWVRTLDAPNTYRGRHRGDEVGRYATEAVAEIERLAASGTPVGAVIAEPYYGNAGGMALPDGYLEAVYAAVRAHGGLAVADEVQVGYGRLGDWFWGFEQQGVVPDIVAVAKAMGNGHPLGAVITTPAIAEQYRSQGYFFSSAGGSPVSSVVGLTVLDVIRDEQLQRNAAETGGYLKQRLAALGDRHPIVGAAHGSGFYLGLEFVRDRVTLEPAPEETAAICERLRELGVIVQPTGDRQCVLKIKPPLCFDRASADAFVDALDEVLTTGW